ncbi:MAG: hypothetical protein ACRDSP_02830 [Pseudonocardiaceae bacterium]
MTPPANQDPANQDPANQDPADKDPVPAHRLSHRLVSMYPRAWQRRFGEELFDLMTAERVGTRQVLDVVAGAIDAHFHLPELIKGCHGMDIRLRRTLVTTLTSAIVLCFGALTLVKITEDGTYSRAERLHPLLGAGDDVARWAAGIGLVLTVLGGLPLAIAGLRQAWRGDRAALWLFAVPPIAVAVWLGCGWLLGLLASHVDLPHWTAALALTGWGTVTLAAAVAGVCAINALVRRLTLPATLLHLATRTARAVAGCLVVAAAGAALFAFVLGISEPALFQGHDGLLATPLPFTLVPWVAISITAATLTSRSVWRARTV